MGQPTQTVHGADDKRLIQFTTPGFLNRCPSYPTLPAQTGHANFRPLKSPAELISCEPATGSATRSYRRGTSSLLKISPIGCADHGRHLQGNHQFVSSLAVRPKRHGVNIPDGVLPISNSGGCGTYRLYEGYGIKRLRTRDQASPGFFSMSTCRQTFP